MEPEKKPRFRRAVPSADSASIEAGIGPSSTSSSFTIPGLGTIAGVTLRPIEAVQDAASGFVSLRRSTRSLASTPVKAEPADEHDAARSAEAGPSTTPRKRVKREPATPTTPRSSRKAVKAEPLDDADPLVDIGDVKPDISPDPKRKPSTPKKAMPLPPLLKAHPAPAKWEEQYRLIERMRKGLLAPVDTIPDLGPVPDPAAVTVPGAPPLSPSVERSLPAQTRRFHVLISLMLSSQTKDPVTSAAVTSLHFTLPGGLTSTSLAAADRATVEGCINKVGFWRRKAEYIQAAAARIEAGEVMGPGETGEKGEIPRTIEGLCELKGVGPKLFNAHGTCVDVHVHRITNRLKWHKPPTITPEQTRVNLESWLPKELHKAINPMLVGFGQMICQPVGPRCDICLLGIKKLCPSRVANVKAEGRKVVEYSYKLSDEGDMEDMVRVVPAVRAELGGGEVGGIVEQEGLGDGLVKLEEVGMVENLVKMEDV